MILCPAAALVNFMYFVVTGSILLVCCVYTDYICASVVRMHNQQSASVKANCPWHQTTSLLINHVLEVNSIGIWAQIGSLWNSLKIKRDTKSECMTIWIMSDFMNYTVHGHEQSWYYSHIPPYFLVYTSLHWSGLRHYFPGKWGKHKNTPQTFWTAVC